jgi:O-antigen/teichoic acid export membrane protein
VNHRRSIARTIESSFWGISDQALVSAANFVTMVVLARALSPADFGLFVLAYAVLLFVGGIQSGLVTQPHNVLGATQTRDQYARYTTSTAVAQIAFAGCAGAVALAAAGMSTVLSLSVTPLLFALTPAVIGWQFQEFVRRVLYTERRPHDALANDVLSYGGQATLVVLLEYLDELTAVRALLVVAVTSGIAAAFGAGQIRGALVPTFDVHVARRNWDFGKWLAASTVGYWFSSHASFYLASAILGAVAAGALKAAQLILGPLNVLLLFLASVVPSRFARSRARGPDALEADVRSVFKFTAPIVVAYCALSANFADELLSVFYADKYRGYAVIVQLFAAYYALSYVAQVIAAALNARLLTKYNFIGNAGGAALGLPVAWAGLELIGVAGALVGMLVTVLFLNGIVWHAYRQSREAEASGPLGTAVMKESLVDGRQMTRLPRGRGGGLAGGKADSELR